VPRPLKILKGIVEQDPSVTRYRTSELLGETTATAEVILKHLSTCLRLLLNKDRASKAEQSIVDLGVRFWNDIRAANILIKEGFILSAMMMERDAIETRVVAEYLNTHPQEVEVWQKAETYKERRRFGINELKGKVADGESWKDLFDLISSYIHPNDKARPAYSKNRPFFGYNLYLGGFYDPAPIAISFITHLSLSVNFLKTIIDWYKNDLLFPIEMSKEVEILEETYRKQANALKERATKEQTAMDEKIQAMRLTPEEKRKLFQFLDTLG